MQAQEIEIKGIKNGIFIELKEGEWEEQKNTLITHIDENLAFFKSARIVLDVGDRSLKSPDLSSLRNDFIRSRYQVQSCIKLFSGDRTGFPGSGFGDQTG